MASLIRWFGGFLILLTGIMAVSFLQKKFDDGDLKKSLNAVHQRFPDAQSCHAEVTSRFRGLVLVTCEGRKWIVDVVHGAILETP